MQQQSSLTALTAAAARTAHLIVDGEPHIFADTLVAGILGEQAEELLRYHRVSGVSGDHHVLRGARTQVVVRSRYTEDRLAEAMKNGMAQYVLLGAGLDSFGYRTESAVRVFVVDHPATQEWKKAHLEKAGIAVPGTVSFVAADFEADSLGDRLTAAGFDPARPAFVSWLGVVMYLTRESVGATLATIGGFAPGTQLVADYMVPADLRDAAGTAYVEGVAPVAAEHGEPRLTSLTPDETAALLTEHGFRVLADVGQHDAIDPGLWKRGDGLTPASLSRLVYAEVR